MFGMPVILSYMLAIPKRRRSLITQLGWGSLPRVPQHLSNQKPIWIHTLSVGETLSAVPLIEALLNRLPQYPLFVSVSTETGMETARQQLRDLPVTLFRSPHDFFPGAMSRLFHRLNPAAVMVVESDMWPNMVNQAAKRNIPLMLVNARLSDRSYAMYRRFRVFARASFASISYIATQSRSDLERYAAIGMNRSQLRLTGNIKFDQPVAPISREALKQFRHRMGIDAHHKVLVAGSTHSGEEFQLAAIHQRLTNKGIGIKLICAPRNPDRSKAVSRLFAEKGIPTECLSSIESGSVSAARCQVIIVDRIGLLRKLYALSDVAVVGGSFVNAAHLGGHNPLEPAAYAKPVIVGANMRNFRTISQQMSDAGGLVQVHNQESLALTIEQLLTNTKKARRLGICAKEVFDSCKGAVNRTIDLLIPCL